MALMYELVPLLHQASYMNPWLNSMMTLVVLAELISPVPLFYLSFSPSDLFAASRLITKPYFLN